MVPLRIRFWRGMHGLANRLAWRYARPSGPEWGIALRVDKTKLLWRINDWLAGRWFPWWLKREMEKQNDEE